MKLKKYALKGVVFIDPLSLKPVTILANTEADLINCTAYRMTCWEAVPAVPIQDIVVYEKIKSKRK